MVGRDADGHFLGFRARLNCENMPVIPAWLVRRNLNDPRRSPICRFGKMNATASSKRPCD